MYFKLIIFFYQRLVIFYHCLTSLLSTIYYREQRNIVCMTHRFLGHVEGHLQGKKTQYFTWHFQKVLDFLRVWVGTEPKSFFLKLVISSIWCSRTQRISLRHFNFPHIFAVYSHVPINLLNFRPSIPSTSPQGVWVSLLHWSQSLKLWCEIPTNGYTYLCDSKVSAPFYSC